MRGIKILSAVAPRCFSFSVTNDPRKPAPPVTITFLSCQKFSVMNSPCRKKPDRSYLHLFLHQQPHRQCLLKILFSCRPVRFLLYDKLSIPIFLIARIPNDPHLQREQQFTNTIIYIESRIKAKHILDLGKRYGDISHITTE